MAGGSARGTTPGGHVLAGLPREWRVLHEVRWPGRRVGQIDHVVVGSAGVLVVIAVDRAGRVRRSDLARARRAAAAVAALVPPLAAVVHPVLYLDREESVPGGDAGVALVGRRSAVDALGSMPVHLDAAEVSIVWRQLCAAIGAMEREAPRRHCPRARRVRRQRRLLAQGLATLGLAGALLVSPEVAGHAEQLIGDLVGVFDPDDAAIRPVNGTPTDPPADGRGSGRP